MMPRRNKFGPFTFSESINLSAKGLSKEEFFRQLCQTATYKAVGVLPKDVEKKVFEEGDPNFDIDRITKAYRYIAFALAYKDTVKEEYVLACDATERVAKGKTPEVVIFGNTRDAGCPVEEDMEKAFRSAYKELYRLYGPKEEEGSTEKPKTEDGMEMTPAEMREFYKKRYANKTPEEVESIASELRVKIVTYVVGFDAQFQALAERTTAINGKPAMDNCLDLVAPMLAEILLPPSEVEVQDEAFQDNYYNILSNAIKEAHRQTAAGASIAIKARDKKIELEAEKCDAQAKELARQLLGEAPAAQPTAADKTPPVKKKPKKVACCHVGQVIADLQAGQYEVPKWFLKKAKKEGFDYPIRLDEIKQRLKDEGIPYNPPKEYIIYKRIAQSPKAPAPTTSGSATGPNGN